MKQDAHRLSFPSGVTKVEVAIDLESGGHSVGTEGRAHPAGQEVVPVASGKGAGKSTVSAESSESPGEAWGPGWA